MTAVGRLRRQARTAGRWLFADRYGFVLWLVLLCWFGATWRVGFFIQDTYATANTLVALADGSLAVRTLRYSLTIGSQPGLHTVDGALYGRNYGQLALAVPFVWLLEGLSAIIAPRFALVGIWTGLGLVLVGQLSQLPRFDRDRTLIVGSTLIAVGFAGSVLTATELPFRQLVLVAYQLSTLVAAATAGLVCYRLLLLFHGRRVAFAAGLGLGVATPIGFWATIPKRHTLVALLTLATVYAFAVSRHRTDEYAAFRARTGAYALAGFVTWTHAFEAFFLVVTLAVVDLATAKSNSPRRLLVVALVLLVASTPMLATNYAISGNPAQPPRLLPNTQDGDVEFAPEPDAEMEGQDGSQTGTGSPGASDGTADESAQPGTATRGSDGGSASVTPTGSADGGEGTSTILDTVRSIAASAETASTYVVDTPIQGLMSLDDPARLYHTFVRSGHIPGVRYRINDYETVELALLEAMPLLGSVIVFPILLVLRLRHGRPGRASLSLPSPRTLAPARQTDLLVGVLAFVLIVIYLSRLPLFSMLTVRYLHPVVPLAAYGVARIPAVRTTVRDEWRWLAGSYLSSVCVALVVVLGGIWLLDLAVGEAVQYHALLNLGAAAVCGITLAGRTVAPGRVSERVSAVGLALAGALTTGYLLLSALVYFRYGTFAFDLIGVLAGVLPSL